MTLSPMCVFRRGNGPLVAAAVHDGHDVRPDVERRLRISRSERLREEDPFTAEWTQFANTQIVGLRSRFEVDLNRPREKAIYRTAEEAWGSDIWREPPDADMIGDSLQEYDQFYATVEDLLRELVVLHGRVVVYDLHSYNFRRNGAEAPQASHPEVNVGTGTMDRAYWAPVVDRFIEQLRGFDFHGRSLDVRENVKFQGGNFGRWIHQKFPRSVCSVAVEFKKFFMDEQTGVADLEQVESIYNALRSTAAGVLAALDEVGET